jgi:hypothetical protein
MKKPIIFAVLLSLLSLGMIEKTISNEKTIELNINEEFDLVQWQKQKEECTIDSLRLVTIYHQGELDNFLSAIGQRESSNRYHITNKWGYMGKYQFGKSTLRGLGFDVTRKEFLSNPELQEEAMLSLLLHNKEKLQKYIDVFDGKRINGMLITESGILAAAHLGGQGSVKRYFKHGKVFKDGYGTKITSYMDTFSGYDIQLN